ncbi:MAG: dephospho-CoA kinase [Candidatus Omnitrophica bacterium]|nr:dephospho-CoA kinase [Candidatus Omnitrophota bacterium]
MVIGLTGSFGTGKTFVASVFRSLGAVVIDADRIAHDTIRRGGPAYGRIVSSFGPGVLGRRREIERRKLAARVFGDRRALSRLNRIVHPEVIRIMKSKIRTAPRGAVVVVDAPLLIEADLLNIADKLVVVKCSQKRQIERCSKKFRIRKREVLRRIRAQIPLKKKLKMADFVVPNDSTKARTRREVRKVWEEIACR